MLIYLGSIVKNQEEINARFLEIVEKGSLSEVKSIVENENADIFYKNSEAVVQCASRGKLGVLQYLIEKGCPANTQDQIALVMAAQLNNFDIVKYFLETHGLLDQFNLHLNDSMLIKSVAKREDTLDMTQYLIQQGCRIDKAKEVSHINNRQWLDMYELNTKLTHNLPVLKNQNNKNKI